MKNRMRVYSQITNNKIQNDEEQLSYPQAYEYYIDRVKNRIYFYSDIEDNRILHLNKELFECSNDLISESIIKQSEASPIYLHVNSLGGTFFSGLSAMDEILRINEVIPITTIVDGVAASAATFITIAGAHRQIKRHSFVLIHQISSVFWGTYEDFKDNEENLDKFMQLMKGMYKTYTKIPMKKLNEILKRDLFFTAEEALEYGIVDEII